MKLCKSVALPLRCMHALVAKLIATQFQTQKHKSKSKKANAASQIVKD